MVHAVPYARRYKRDAVLLTRLGRGIGHPQAFKAIVLKGRLLPLAWSGPS